MGYEYPSSFTRTVHVEDKPTAPVLYDANGTALVPAPPPQIGFKPTDKPKQPNEASRTK